MLYIGDKGVNVAARPPEGGLAEVGGLSASNLPLISIPHRARMPHGPAKAGKVISMPNHYILLKRFGKKGEYARLSTKWLCKYFGPPHTNQSRYSVLKQKNVPRLIYKYFSATVPIFLDTVKILTFKIMEKFSKKSDEDSEDGQEYEAVNNSLGTRNFMQWHLGNPLKVSRHWTCFRSTKIWSPSKAIAQYGAETDWDSKSSTIEDFKTNDGWV